MYIICLDIVLYYIKALSGLYHIRRLRVHIRSALLKYIGVSNLSHTFSFIYKIYYIMYRCHAY